jgi:hypothetical protein
MIIEYFTMFRRAVVYTLFNMFRSVFRPYLEKIVYTDDKGEYSEDLGILKVLSVSSLDPNVIVSFSVSGNTLYVKTYMYKTSSDKGKWIISNGDIYHYHSLDPAPHVKIKIVYLIP